MERLNYIKEINAFRNYLRTHPLEAITQALWYVLIDYHNSSNWEQWITIDNSRLMAELQISENTLIKHRNKLIQAGLLEYKSQQRKKNSGKYKLISLEEVNKTTSKNTAECEVKYKTTSKNEADFEAECEAECEADLEAECSDIYKLNKTKLNKKNNNSSCSSNSNSNDMPEIYRYYEQAGFGVINGKAAEFLDSMVEMYSKEWVMKAIDQAVKNGKYNLKYVEGILMNWKRNGGIQENKPKKEAKSTKKIVNHPYINYSGQRQYDVAELEKNLLGKGELSNG